jgi:hypothetical protein
VGVVTFFGGVIVAVLSRLGADEAKTWLPHIVNRCLLKAVNRLPEGQRERMEEEWRADLEQWPSDFSRLWRTVGFGRAAAILSPVEGLSWKDRLFATAPRREPSRFDLLIDKLQLTMLGLMAIWALYYLMFRHLDRSERGMVLTFGLPAIPAFICMFAAMVYQAKKRREREELEKEES